MPDYIANCIGSVIDAEADNSKRHQRERDLAEAVRIAAASGEKAAHTYLIQLAKQSRDGKYK